MSLAPEHKLKRVFYKTVLLASLAFIPLYAIFWTSYLSLTDEMPWWNVLTLDMALFVFSMLLLLAYFRTVRKGKLRESLRSAGGGSMAKGILLASFGSLTMGAASLEEGDGVHIHCKGFETYCRVIDWGEI